MLWILIGIWIALVGCFCVLWHGQIVHRREIERLHHNIEIVKKWAEQKDDHVKCLTRVVLCGNPALFNASKRSLADEANAFDSDYGSRLLTYGHWRQA